MSFAISPVQKRCLCASFFAQQIDDTYVPHGREHWKWPPGRMDQWGITGPHTQRWKQIQDLLRFRDASLK